jgi:hypothetical protein
MSLPHEKEPWISPPRDGEDPKELALMLSGQPYLSPDPYIGRIRDAHGVRMQQINRIDDTGERMNAMREFIHMGTNVWIVQGFFCEYVSESPVLAWDTADYGPGLQHHRR